MLCKQCSTRIGEGDLRCKDCGHEGYEPTFADVEYEAALERVWAEAETRLGAPMRGQHSVKSMVDLWQYAKSRIDFNSTQITADEAAWRLLRKSTGKALRQGDAALMDKLEESEQNIDAVRGFRDALAAATRAQPNDYGYRVPLGFMLIGAVIGFLLSRQIASVLIGGVISWIAGFLFSIFVINSVRVQVSLGFQLEGTLFTNSGRWFIRHALKDYWGTKEANARAQETSSNTS
jgi:hypothetical protein